MLKGRLGKLNTHRHEIPKKLISEKTELNLLSMKKNYLTATTDNSRRSKAGLILFHNSHFITQNSRLSFSLTLCKNIRQDGGQQKFVR